MTHLLNLFYNWSFAIGALFGYLAMRLYCRISDHRAGRRPGTTSRIWIAGFITLAVLGWVLLTAQKAADETVAIAQAQKRCQDQINDVVRTRATFTEPLNALNKKRQDLLDELDAADSDWLQQLLQPPDPEIAKLSVGDPRRQEYGLDVTRVYFHNASKIRAQIADVSRQQDELNKALASHPIPPLCQ